MAVYTIPGEIVEGDNLNISNARLHRHKVLAVEGDKLVINYLPILSKYLYPLESYIETLEMDEDRWRDYRFKPKSVSYALYGTIELATTLMSLNGIVSISEFNMKRLKVFTPAIKDVLKEILNKEKKAIQDDTAEVNEDIKA